ncbi:MAG TPA: hypothetical protein VFF33_06135 [Ignavibacteriaceae bacterium]|nr:hypothetical protein [Ignavibacteriaceae bacterium]
MKLKLVLIFSLFYVFYHSANAQNNAVGLQLGGGFISSISPDVGAFSSSFFYERYINPATAIRFSFVYTGDYNMIVPNTRKKYEPFIKGITVSGINHVPLNNLFYVEPGIGLAALNDRIFNGKSEWGYGVLFSLGWGRRVDNISYSANAEYALTFTASNPKYFSLTLQGRYFF